MLAAMKVALHVVEARRRRMAELLQQRRYLPLAELCGQLGISPATARRDLAVLASDQSVTRTHGGALCDFNQRFPSFRERLARSPVGKQRIATAARALIKPGMTCWLDGGTTTLGIAQALAARPVAPLTVVTNNLPAAEALADVDGVAVHLLGGQYLRRLSILLGPQALRGLRAWSFDLAFLGAEGMTDAGLWNSQADVIALQKAIVRQAPTCFCVDGQKVGQRAADFLLPWPKVERLLTDAGAADLAAAGIVLPRGRLLHA